MTNYKEIILKLLKEDPRCERDDKWLCFKVYEIICKQNQERVFIPFRLFKKLPSFETISRTRRKIFEEKEFTPEISISKTSAYTSPNSYLMG